MKNWITTVVFVALMLVAPRLAVAHEGHDHTVMGTIASIEGMNLMVKAQDGKSTMVMLDAKTKITQGKTTLALKDLKVGDRVVAAGPEEKSMIMAETVKVGAQGSAAKK
jgi:hypothetical protein